MFSVTPHTTYHANYGYIANSTSSNHGVLPDDQQLSLTQRFSYASPNEKIDIIRALPLFTKPELQEIVLSAIFWEPDSENKNTMLATFMGNALVDDHFFPQLSHGSLYLIQENMLGGAFDATLTPGHAHPTSTFKALIASSNLPHIDYPVYHSTVLNALFHYFNPFVLMKMRVILLNHGLKYVDHRVFFKWLNAEIQKKQRLIFFVDFFTTEKIFPLIK